MVAPAPAPTHKFRRQNPIGPDIADFACIDSRLIVEIDGGTYGTVAEIAHDRARDAFLRSKRWRIVRVSNDDVYRHLSEVLNTIDAWLDDVSSRT